MVTVVVTKIRKYSDLCSSDSAVYTNQESVKVINYDFFVTSKSTLLCCSLLAVEILIRVNVVRDTTLWESERISIIIELQLEMVGLVGSR